MAKDQNICVLNGIDQILRVFEFGLLVLVKSCEGSHSEPCGSIHDILALHDTLVSFLEDHVERRENISLSKFVDVTVFCLVTQVYAKSSQVLTRITSSNS